MEEWILSGHLSILSLLGKFRNYLGLTAKISISINYQNPQNYSHGKSGRFEGSLCPSNKSVAFDCTTFLKEDDRPL